MCLILFAFQGHPKYPLVIAANRDEFYKRPTKRAGWWKDHPDILAGRDLKGGGSWMGVNKQGQFAALTNVREPAKFDPDAPSRGPLVIDFLINNPDPSQYLKGISESDKEFNGYNLILGNKDHLFYSSNRSVEAKAILPGVYGLSNDQLDTPWPKVERGKKGLQAFLSNDDLVSSADSLFNILKNSNLALDEELPYTGVSLEWERRLSPMFIESPEYGTMVSTVLLIDESGEIYFEERGYVPKEDNLAFQFSCHYPLKNTLES
ncbi:UNVERIFIED_CONTAM: hypothetical protein GTU68_011223 [Idotea baltica]|nr:hypothetical protein [Idotea baltica]